MKIRVVKPELFRVDGRTDRHDEANGSLFAVLQKTPNKMSNTKCVF